MIEDARDTTADCELRPDICIVGAGAAGISMALELERTGLDVLLLESGGEKLEPSTQQLYAGTVADARLHSPLDSYRMRCLGGSTTAWGGRCMPLDPIDFERRDYVDGSGWPMGLADLLPFYPKANQICEAGPFEYTAEEAFHRPTRPMIAGFAGPHFSTNTLERFSCPTDFGRRYRQRLADARNVRVLLHANATALHLAGNGMAVDRVDVTTLAGRQFAVRPRFVVLAAGGLEVTRLLLASRDARPAGIGNDFDQVGRYYMCHLAGTIGALSLTHGQSAAWHGYDLSDEGVYCRRRLALTADAQRRHRIGNFIARLHHPRITDPAHHNSILSLLYLAKPIIPYEYRKRLHGDAEESAAVWLRHVANVARDPFSAVGFAWHLFRDRRLAARKFPSIIIRPKANLFSIDFHAEQFPNASSRVTLGPQADALRVPRLHVDWRYTAEDVATVATALSLLANDLAASGVGRLDYNPATIEAEMTRYGAYGGHHIGTTRMGTDRRTSVVDPDCRLHDVDNLYVASSSVFPTSSQANPTLTVVALALRLADHLAARSAGVLPATVDTGGIASGTAT